MNIKESIKNEIEALLEILPKMRNNFGEYEYCLRNINTLIGLSMKLRDEAYTYNKLDGDKNV